MCDSTYTIDRKTGEKLHCNRGPEGHDTHYAEYRGKEWYWMTREEDK